MARTKEFDTEKAIKAATKLFWREGYKKASVQALMKVMNIGEGSFYNTYKSKKNLFIMCLDYYNRVLTKDRYDALVSELPVKERIRNYFNVIFDSLTLSRGVQGCLASNSLTYEILKDKTLNKVLLKEVDKFRETLIESFDEAKLKKELPSDFHSQFAANSIITYVHGIFKIAVTTNDFEELREQTDFFLSSLRL